MTRMLWKVLIGLWVISMMGSCAFFSGGETIEEVDLDKESLSVGEIDLGEEDVGLDLDEGDTDLELGEEDADLDLEEVALSDEENLTEDESFDEGLEEIEDLDEEAFENLDEELGATDQELAPEEPEGLSEEDSEEAFVAEALDGPEAELSEAESSDESNVQAQEPQGLSETDSQNEVSSPENRVTNLEYKAFEKGGTVVIETMGPANYEQFTDPNLNQVVIQMDNVFLPERFKRPYVTKDFKQDIATINAYTDENGSSRFVIQLKRPIEPIVQQEGNSVLVMTSPDIPMKNSGMNQLADAGQDPDQGESFPEGAPSQMEAVTLSPDGSKFTGEKINLEYVDADIRVIIQDITERSGANLVMDADVSGKTSIRLREIPWDQALFVILRSQSLGYVKQGNVLRVARQSTLSKEAQEVSTQLKKEKQARLLAEGLKVKYIPVSYAKVSELSQKLKGFTSKEGKVAFDDRTSSLVITDYDEYIGRIEELVKALDTSPMQVEIEAKLVEAREDFIREAGINWDLSGRDFTIGGTKTGNAQLTLGGELPAQGFTLDLSVGTFDIFGDLTAALNVFERANKIKVLSQPRVVTMNKVKAEVSQVTQVPISTTTITPGAPALQQFSFVDLTLSLEVTPQITFKGDVILDVELKREFAGAQNSDGSRELNKRRAKSTVMVQNGKTAVIGGIYQLDDGNLESGIPILKDLPFIGYLFKQKRKEKIKNELLLFLKPKILGNIEGPMVSKSGAPSADYDPFENVSVDEEEETDTFAPEGESLEEELQDEELEEIF